MHDQVLTTNKAGTWKKLRGGHLTGQTIVVRMGRRTIMDEGSKGRLQKSGIHQERGTTEAIRLDPTGEAGVTLVEGRPVGRAEVEVDDRAARSVRVEP